MTKYDAESIQVLEDLEHIRKRPGMYLGSQDSNGIFHALKEPVDNSIDEFLVGYAKNLYVEIDSKTHVFLVRDDGRGIPVGTHPKTGESTLTTVLTNLQAGGKFSKEAYSMSAGLHGVGLKATNAVSEWLLARVWRKGRCYEQRFVRGVPDSPEPNLNKSLNVRGKTGTEISFLPDSYIFGDHRIDLDKVRSWLESLSFLCPGLHIHLSIDGDSSEYQSEGLKDLVLRNRGGSNKALHTPLVVETEDKSLSVALLWTDGEGENWFSACNASPTPEHGKHVDGAMRAIAKVLAPYAKKKSVDPRDLTDGLVGAIQVLLAHPQFKSQTKEALVNPEVRDQVYDALYPHLKSFFDQHPKVAENIASRAVQIKKARESYKKIRSAINQTAVKKNARGVLPNKLAEAIRCSPKERELFLVEGDSAGGSAKMARDPAYQEILPLKGKIPNAAQTPLAKLLQNEEVASIFKATGAQLHPKGKSLDLSNLRVGKVLLLSDADQDGQHISSLVLTLFCLYLTDLVRGGYVYVVDSPLFIGAYKGNRWFAHTHQDLEKMSGVKIEKLQVTRVKGHGEANAADIRRYALNPETRKLWHVQMGDKDLEVILSLMGSDSSSRKTLLGV